VKSPILWKYFKHTCQALSEGVGARWLARMAVKSHKWLTLNMPWGRDLLNPSLQVGCFPSWLKRAKATFLH
jgi:hypothetical protein